MVTKPKRLVAQATPMARYLLKVGFVNNQASNQEMEEIVVEDRGRGKEKRDSHLYGKQRKYGTNDISQQPISGGCTCAC